VFNLRVSFFVSIGQNQNRIANHPRRSKLLYGYLARVYREKLYLARLSAQSVGTIQKIKLTTVYATAGGIVNHKLIVALVVVYCRYLSWFIFRHLLIYLVYANHVLTPRG
jgi:hypothetical protein